MFRKTNTDRIMRAAVFCQRNRQGMAVKVFCGIAALLLLSTQAFCGDLAQVREQGVLRHLGITYANFVRETDAGVDGLDVELMQLFARHLNVRYEWVKTSWSEVFEDLTGTTVRSDGDEVLVTGRCEVRGDVIANGLTILPWRQKLVNFSLPTFPTGVWLVARADSTMKPIEPSGKIDVDIHRVKSLLKGRTVLAMKGTCLDADLYDLSGTGAEIRFHVASQNLNDIAPAILNGAAEATLLDVPDALVALQKWPGDVKIIGPISEPQLMGIAVSKSSPEMCRAFNEFFDAIWKDGTYRKLVEKYYPSVFLYLGEFFQNDLKK